LASNFNNNTLARATADEHAPAATSPAPVSPAPPNPAPATPAAISPAPGTHPPVTSDVPASAAFVRFRSCRWMQPAENGNQEFCTHREVKPYAGTTGFDPDAWCPECQYYKLRRAPKKRDPSSDYSY
jgi:hypothetical protein